MGRPTTAIEHRDNTEAEMTAQLSGWMPMHADRQLIKHALTHIASDGGLATVTISDALQAQAETLMITPGLVELTETSSSDNIGLILASRKRQLAYSLKLSNFLRDPVPTVSASGLMIAATFYVPSVLDKLPPTFPAFLVALTFAVLRAFAHPIGYGEAALLHALHRFSRPNGVVLTRDIDNLGAVLVNEYGYVKGGNHNEVKALLRSLVAWSAIDDLADGFRLRESVPFGIALVDDEAAPQSP